MKATFDEQLIAAVRLAGPDALPSAVFIEMGGDRAGGRGSSGCRSQRSSAVSND